MPDFTRASPPSARSAPTTGLTVLRGTSTPEELAVIVACFAALAARAATSAPPPPTSSWGRSAREESLRSPLPPRGGWASRGPRRRHPPDAHRKRDTDS
jgi:hypothetical protein